MSLIGLIKKVCVVVATVGLLTLPGKISAQGSNDKNTTIIKERKKHRKHKKLIKRKSRGKRMKSRHLKK